MPNEKKYTIELKKKEIDEILDSLAFRQKELQNRINKTKNLNSKKYRDNIKELDVIEKLSDDLYKIDKNFSRGILLELYN